MQLNSLTRTLNDRFVRIRHWRGHGVHSPFAYSFVREVFMKRNRQCAGPLYDALRGVGCKARQAGLVQSAYSFLDCNTFILNGKIPAETGEAVRTMYIVMPKAAKTHTELTAVCDSGLCAAICLLFPGSDPQWYETCRKTVAGHCGMSIDCRNAIFLFTYGGLNKEHIKL